MSSFRIRELREDDADAVARLFVEAWGDARRMNGDEIRQWLANEVLLAENLLVVVDGDDRVVGYFDVWQEGESVDVDLAAPGIWEETLDHAENRARALGANRVRTFVSEGHDVADRISGRGYRQIRSSWTMEIEFGVEAPAEPVIPDGIDIKLNYPERADDPGYGFIGSIGVRRPWRRRGVGEALLRRTFALLHARGLRKVRLLVDSENPTGATRLYERVGMSVLRQSNTWEHGPAGADSAEPEN
jgi:ribosomal protein S18 acetylase RimI-like enzyme